MFSILRPYIFSLDPEVAHDLAIKSLKANILPKSFFNVEGQEMLETKLLGRTISNPIGLAAGFDKSAEVYNSLFKFGFGFIEIGTVTPKPQHGNPKKRLFRLKEDTAIINRMGFNNDGVTKIKNRLKKNYNVLIGGNIGKNKVTTNSQAKNDYIICFKELYNYVDYFVVNVSSPNTPGLRELQSKEFLNDLFIDLNKLRSNETIKKPILIKISPDLSKEKILEILEVIDTNNIDGIIATNTTIDYPNLKSKNKNETGGLSGAPLYDKSNEVISFISKKTNGKLPIIGVGGISTPEQAVKKIEAGAHLIQLYTGIIYEGPGIVRKINKKLLNQEL